MKSLVDLLDCMASELGAKLGVDVARDVKTTRSRVEHEGESFLTLTLPAFCADLERALADGRVGPGMWSGFSKLPSGIPALWQGFLSNVFDQSGNLRAYPSVDCIRAVRQLCLFCKKIERPCSDARIARAIDGYVSCDDGLSSPEGQLWRYFGYVADIIVGDMVKLESVLTERLCPQHGPGATRERIRGNAKWRFRRWHMRLEDAGFTWRSYARGSMMDPVPEEGYEPPELVEPGQEEPVRVVLVPKTLKGPRIIAVEPVCMQYAQQALKRLLVGEIETSPYTSGRVNFSDQGVNQRLAKDGSESGNIATIDMSEASDRVSLEHASRLFLQAPLFWRMALAARSTHAELPDGRVIALKKFASMGSALCFPVEALAFFVSAVASRILRAGRFPTARLVRQYGRGVYVYGDDIILPADETPDIVYDLELLGFKVNTRKSFWSGHFRESCGSDWYGGETVKPVYLRRDLPLDVKDTSGLLSSVSTANQLAHAGLWKTATVIRKAVERTIGHLPEVPLDSAAVGWRFIRRYESDTTPRRWNRRLQRWEFSALVAVPAQQQDPLEGDAALAKCLLVGGSSQPPGAGTEFYRFMRSALDIPTTPEDHLLVSPRPYALKLKRRWVPCY